MKRALVLWLVAACGDGKHATPDAAPARAEVGLMRPAALHDLDVLFVIDDGPASILDKQNELKAAFPALVDVLAELPGGVPNLHLGVVTTDLGTSSQLDAQPAPPIGTGTGMCAGTGKNGELQTFGSTAVTGRFLSDVADGSGGRTTSFTGTLSDAFGQIASAGASGCGFEQPIEAMHRALANNPANAGFLRDPAALAIVTLTDEDDHSASHAAFFDQATDVLGPLSDFRSTRWGVTCADGGTTPDEMNTVGTKGRCTSNEASPYVVHLADEVAFLHGLKAEPRDVLYAGIVGPRSPVEVALGGVGTQSMPVLRPACTYVDATNSTLPGEPSMRISAFADRLPRSDLESICAPTVAAVTAIGRSIKNLLGDPCLVRDIALPADCTVTDDTTGAALPFTLTPDPATCPDGQHLRLALTGAPAATWARVRCVLP